MHYAPHESRYTRAQVTLLRQWHTMMLFAEQQAQWMFVSYLRVPTVRFAQNFLITRLLFT